MKVASTIVMEVVSSAHGRDRWSGYRQTPPVLTRQDLGAFGSWGLQCDSELHDFGRARFSRPVWTMVQRGSAAGAAATSSKNHAER